MLFRILNCWPKSQNWLGNGLLVAIPMPTITTTFPSWEKRRPISSQRWLDMTNSPLLNSKTCFWIWCIMSLMIPIPQERSRANWNPDSWWDYAPRTLSWGISSLICSTRALDLYVLHSFSNNLLLMVLFVQGLYQRLQYIFAQQNWETLGNTYWIRQALDLILASATQSVLAYGINLLGILVSSLIFHGYRRGNKIPTDTSYGARPHERQIHGNRSISWCNRITQRPLWVLRSSTYLLKYYLSILINLQYRALRPLPQILYCPFVNSLQVTTTWFTTYGFKCSLPYGLS